MAADIRAWAFVEKNRLAAMPASPATPATS